MRPAPSFACALVVLGWTRRDAAAAPLHVVLVFGGSSDRCGERRFAPNACQASSNGKRPVCRG